MMKTRIPLLLLIAMAFAHSAYAAKWTRAGLYGADVRAMALDSANPDRVYLGTSQGGVYVSDDGGRSWANPRGANPFPGFVIDELVVDRSARLWAAGWGLWGGGVIAVSDDGGRTWKRRDEGIGDLSVRAFTVSEADPDVLLAGGLTGVYRSRDLGESWERIADLPNVNSIAMDPGNVERVVVGTWRQAYRTENGGRDWTLIADGMVADTDVFAITMNRLDPDNIWLATCGWVYHSTNGGDGWTRYRDGFDNRRIHDVQIDPSDSRRVLAGSVAGLYRTEDHGISWSRISDDSLVINSILVTPDRPDRIILGTEGDGVYVSEDGGNTWERTNRGLHNVRVAVVAPDPVEPTDLYAAVIFGNAASGVYRSTDGGGSWSRLSRGVMPEVLALIVQDEGPSRFVAGTEKGFFASADGVDWHETTPLPLHVGKIVRYGKHRLFAETSDGVYTSRDGGAGWYRLRGGSRAPIDLEIGTFGGAPALYVLVDGGIEIFDGRDWSKTRNVPGDARGIELHSIDGVEAVIISTAESVMIGTIEGGIWRPSDPASELSVKLGMASEVDRAIIAARKSSASPFSADWDYVRLPVPQRLIASIASDPSNPRRLFVATHGDGIFILEEYRADEAGGR